MSTDAKYSALGNPKVLKLLKGSMEGANPGLLEASQASASWNKHNSALNSFERFAKDVNSNIIMPYTVNNLCSYVSWALLTAKLKPNTVRAYLCSIQTLHKLKNLHCDTSNYICCPGSYHWG